MTIQLCKLLTESKNQKFNLHKLLDRLLSEPIDLELSELIKKNSKKPFVKVFRDKTEFEKVVANLREQLKSYHPVVQKLKTSRDTLYAHREHDAVPQNVTLENINSLVSFCVEVHNTIRGGFYDESINYSHTSSWNIDFVLKECSLGRLAKLKR